MGNGRQMGIEAHLAVGRDPLDAAIGGDALLKAAVHQLGVVALLLHLRWGEGCGVRSRGRGRVRFSAEASAALRVARAARTSSLRAR